MGYRSLFVRPGPFLLDQVTYNYSTHYFVSGKLQKKKLSAMILYSSDIMAVLVLMAIDDKMLFIHQSWLAMDDSIDFRWYTYTVWDKTHNI